MLYEHTQPGTWVRILSTVFIVVGIIIYYSTADETSIWVAVSLMGIGIVISAIFTSLQTAVDSNFLYISYSVGLVRRKIPLESIDSVKQVRNPWWYGFGIRLTPRGWLWNIQGLDAIELTYKNGRSFRIGTDDPKGLESALSSSL